MLKVPAMREMGTGTRMETGSRRANERRRSARNQTRVVHAIWGTGETCGKREKSSQGLVENILTEIVENS